MSDRSAFQRTTTAGAAVERLRGILKPITEYVGVEPDAVAGNDCSCTSGNTTVTFGRTITVAVTSGNRTITSSGLFLCDRAENPPIPESSKDSGKLVRIAGAGPGGAELETYIERVPNTNTAVLLSEPSASVTGPCRIASKFFGSSDVGKTIWIERDDQAQADKVTTIAAVGSELSITVASAPSFTAVGAKFRTGTDVSDAIQNAFDDAYTTPSKGMRPGRFFFPRGGYLITKTINVWPKTTVVGEGYCSTSKNGDRPSDPQSVVYCCAPVPAFASGTDTHFSEAVTFDSMGIMGVNKAGSMGIKIKNGWDWCTWRNFFDTFGGPAVKHEFGIVASYQKNFAQNCCLVVTGLSDYVGVFDLSVSDADIVENNLNGAFPAGREAVGGWTASLVCRNTNNAFIAHNQLAQSEHGMVLKAESGWNKISHNRADINAIHGFICGARWNIWTGNHSHRNSRGEDGTGDGFYVTEAGQVFTGNTVLCVDGYDNVDPPTGTQTLHRHGFHDVSAVGLDSYANRYTGNFVPQNQIRGSQYYTNNWFATPRYYDLEYALAQPDDGATLGYNANTGRNIWWDPVRAFLGIGWAHPEAKFHLYVPYDPEDAGFDPHLNDLLRLESPSPIITFKALKAPDNAKIWLIQPFTDGTQSEFFLLAGNDAYTANSRVFQAARTGHLLDYVGLNDGKLFVYPERTAIDGSVQVIGKNALGVEQPLKIRLGTTDVKLFVREGSPEGVLAAVGASLCFDAVNAALYLKVSGSDENGWDRIYAGKELPGAPAGRVLVSQGGSPTTWAGSIVNLSNPESILINGAANGDILTKSGGVIAGASPATIAAAVRPYIIEIAQNEVTGLTSRLSTIETNIANLQTGLAAALDDIADLVGSLGSKADIGHSHSGTTGLGGDPAHDHSISL